MMVKFKLKININFICMINKNCRIELENKTMKIKIIWNNHHRWKQFFLNMEISINRAFQMDLQGQNLWNI
jgi:hypothetical protein